MKNAGLPFGFLVLAIAAVLSCGGSGASRHGDDDQAGSTDCAPDRGDSALSGSLAPTRDPSYYVDQSLRYFDTLDSYADPASVPDYSTRVARWEWPPWLKLTGLGADPMRLIDRLLRLDPTSVPTRDCRFFPTQPFGRCRVVFDYPGGPCPIYEEFTFNDAGEMTFIEAWSDLPGLLPSPDPGDAWAEGQGVHRLSTKVPGLGGPAGLIDPLGDCMRQAADQDADIADFAKRARDPVGWWLKAFVDNPDSFGRGCGWGSADCAVEK